MPLAFIVVGFGQLVKERLLPSLFTVINELDKQELHELYGIEEITLMVLTRNPQSVDEYLNQLGSSEILKVKTVDINELSKLNESLQEFNTRYAYIASPNETHAMYLEFFIDKANMIFVEKPICEHYKEIEPLLEKIDEETQRKIRMIDHYLYKGPIRDLIINLTKYYHLIGEIEKIKFYLLEKDPIDKNRQWLYRSGAVRDFLSHFLSIIFKLNEMYPRIIPSKPVKILGVKKARYSFKDLDYEVEVAKEELAETYAEIKMKVDYLPAQVYIGRGVEADRKQLIIEGDKADIIIDLIKNETVLKSNGKKVPLYSAPSEPKSEYYYILKEILTKERNIGLGFNYAILEVKIFDVLDKYESTKTYKIGTHPKFFL